MKRCSGCGETKALEDFSRSSKRADGRQPRCRACAQRWYEANREARKAKVKARNTAVRIVLRGVLLDYLRDHPCVDCGESDVEVLEFDHRPGSGKTKEVSKFVGSAMSPERLLEEIAKCDVRCANCHRRVTGRRNGNYRARAHADEAAERAALASARLSVLASQARPR